MILHPPIYWKVNQSENVKEAMKKALNTDAVYFESKTENSKFLLVPFKDQVQEQGNLWSRKQIELAMKYQN